MSLHFYSEKEDYLKEESINKYVDIFIEYVNNPPTLSEALKQMFISLGITEEQSNELIRDIKSKTEEIINKNWNKIKKKYSKITKEDSKIISSYTCESKYKKFSPYKILNKNMVSDDRKEGIKNISKYLFILLKSLRKLDKYYPTETEKYLYRCINSKVNINYDIFNKKLIPYIAGNTKTFWGFTSSSPEIKMTYNFLNGEENNKSGTIFTLSGKVWGYDITLFNYFHEKEILIEPERKFKIDEVIPPINEIIHIRCDIQDTPLILNEDLIVQNIKKKSQKNSIRERNDISELYFDYLLKFVIIGDANVGKSNILRKLSCGQNREEFQTIIGVEFCSKNIEIRNKIYRVQIWDTAGQENFRYITRLYYKKSTCAIMVYSITDRNSFDHLIGWIDDCKEMAPKTITMVLVGNNAHEENKREVSYKEGKSLAKKYGMQFFEISAETGQNIDELFFSITDEIAKKIENGFYDLKDDNCGIKIGSSTPYSDIKVEYNKGDSNCIII